MNYTFYLVFAIFSAFMALFLSEAMGAFQMLFNWEKSNSKVISYITPVWEITGTFAAFFVVAADFAFPKIIIPLASIYAGEIMVFLIFFVARNATFVVGEFVSSRGYMTRKKMFKAYSIVTLFIGFVALLVVGGIIGSDGVSIASMSFSPVAWFLNPSSYILILSAVFLIAGLSYVFYDTGNRSKSAIFSLLGIVFGGIAFYLLNSAVFSVLIIIPVVIIVIPVILSYIRKITPILKNKAFLASWVALDVFTLNFLVYPTAFKGAINVQSVTTSGPMDTAFFIITAFGLVLLLALFAVYGKAVKNSRNMKKMENITE
ncbi:MAG: hypothetical protein B2I18_05565 [Cuniculiplasma sp. C_DKE]|uniref:Multipass membrane protein n=1 Tax=Cuniculiplasma divulgatum TaxID=1673428 RepID=A0A1R4A673_9ARCH|nr:hypothetical protein [Cuniculiplasma divulgatum]OWP54702.1 MAG: hypothetical protein B2I18_05565 [Cuniculiplasma sp. C_DKE]SJK84471.1 multipass membrane protein [Cuniculiplasma divulgatum]